MPFAELDSVRLHYELDGPQCAPVLVLSNSLGTDLGMWDQQVDFLARGLRILRYDTRGHGLSSVPPGPYSLQTLGEDVLGLLDLLGIKTASFCGVSLGGMTALWLGIHAPGRITSLVAANTAARIGTREMWDARIDQVRKHGMVSLVDGTMERWFTAKFRLAHPNIILLMRRMLTTNCIDGYTACCAAIRDMDQTGEVGLIRVPTLVISGAYDPVTLPENGRFLEDAITGARYLELDAAHLSNIEDAERFNSSLLDFVFSEGELNG